MGVFNWLFARACKVVFDKVDRDKNGRLEVKVMLNIARIVHNTHHTYRFLVQELEIEIAILHLYNVFNKRVRDIIKHAVDYYSEP